MEVTILDPNPYGPLSEERLEAFERRIGATLPPDYRAFLLRDLLVDDVAAHTGAITGQFIDAGGTGRG